MKKKNLKAMGAACAAAILACSCGSSKNALQTSALEGEWNIITVNGQKAEAEKDPYIGMNLQEKRLYGCAGCNRIMGSLQVDEDKAGQLSFGQVGATRMLCNDMTTEHAVLAALDKVAGYEGSEKELTLTDGDGNALLTLAKRPAATLASPKANGTSRPSTDKRWPTSKPPTRRLSWNSTPRKRDCTATPAATS